MARMARKDRRRALRSLAMAMLGLAQVCGSRAVVPASVAALGPAPGSFAPCSFGVTHYRLQGRSDAPLVVCSHGLGADLRAFDFVTDALVERGLQVLSYDFLDRGWSETSAEFPSDGFVHALKFDTELYVRQVDELLEHLGLQDRELLWLGHSTGVAVGLAYGARNPAAVQGLVMCAAAGLPVRVPFVARFADVPWGIGNWVTRRLGHMTFRRLCTNAYGGNVGALKRFKPETERLLQRKPKYFASIRSTNKHFPFGGFQQEFETLCDAGVPVRLLWGDADIVTPFANCITFERIARERGVDVAAFPFPGAPHSFHFDPDLQPRIRDIVREFAGEVMLERADAVVEEHARTSVQG